MQDLTNYKNIYLGIEIPDNIVQKNWELLVPNLPNQKRVKTNERYIKFGAVFLTLVVIVAATIGLAQAAKPGEALYSVKSFTKKLSSVFTASVVENNVKANLPKKIIPTTPKITPVSTKETNKQDAVGSTNGNKNTQLEQVQKQNGNPLPTSSRKEDQVKGASTQNSNSNNPGSHSSDSHVNQSQANPHGKDFTNTHQENNKNK